jgi:1,4-alpha-glucan branching enzyme
MPGDEWQKRANLRLLYGYLYTQPGKKLLFMGGEFGQWSEWSHDASLDWHLLDEPAHAMLLRWVRDLNTAYRGEPALHELDTSPAGFEWIDSHDSEQSVLVYADHARSSEDELVVACNFTPVPRPNYRIGVPTTGRWAVVLNSDAVLYGGSGQGNLGGVVAAPVRWHGRAQSINVTRPPLWMVVFRGARSGR